MRVGTHFDDGIPKQYRAAILLVGALALLTGLRLAPSQTTAVAAAGAFLVVTGVQLALWSLGIRLELFGVATDADESLSDPSNSPPFELARDRAVQNLRVVEHEFSGAGFRLEVVDDAERITHEVLETAASSSSLAALILLTNEVERAVRGYLTNGESPSDVRGRMAQEVWLAYDAFWKLRNSIIHGRHVMSEPDALEVIDIGIRLLRLLPAALNRPARLLPPPKSSAG
jgi:hypothetical protein